jgi:hypothetical protein
MKGTGVEADPHTPLKNKRRLLLLGLVFAGVLGVGLLLAGPLAEVLVRPLVERAWRAARWLSDLPFIVWWVLLLVIFFFGGLRAFFYDWQDPRTAPRTPAREQTAAWVRRWQVPIRQSTGGPFIRDAMMSYRRLALSVLAQGQGLSTRQVARQIMEGERRLPPEVTGLLDSLERMDEQRGEQNNGGRWKSLRRGFLRRLGRPSAPASAGESRPIPAEQQDEVRRNIETLIQYLEREVEIRHDPEPR